MSETLLDEVFEQALSEIIKLKPELSEDEQNFVDIWLTKLKDNKDEEGKEIRQEYINQLKSQLERDPRRLSVPFNSMPPNESLPPFRDLLPKDAAGSPSERSRYFYSTGEKKPCRPKETPTKKPDIRSMKRSMRNEFENPEGMAISIARSKGMMLPQFVADISRHTADKGHELRAAMKCETAYFSDYVEKIVTQRIKDIGDILDDKQAHEMTKIRKDYDKWQAELSICKKRLKEIVPEFDIDSYKCDRNYFKKIFSVDSSNPPDEDKFKEWKEENCHRIMWFMNEITKLTEENNRVLEEISAIKSKAVELERRESEKQKCYTDQIQTESKRNKQLKMKSDKIAREITDLRITE